MLNLVFFDYPFIHIDRFCITLSSFFIMLFFLLSNGAHWYFWEKKYPKKGLSILWSEAKIIWKPKLMSSISRCSGITAISKAIFLRTASFQRSYQPNHDI